jgi:hypothetical protein
LLFKLGFAICSAMLFIDALIIGRAICGITGLRIYIKVITLLAITTTIYKYLIYISNTSLTWGLRTILGLVTGSSFSDSLKG